MKNEKKVTSIRLSESLIKDLKHYAEKDTRSTNNFIEATLTEKIKELKAQENKTNYTTSEKVYNTLFANGAGI